MKVYEISKWKTLDNVKYDILGKFGKTMLLIDERLYEELSPKGRGSLVSTDDEDYSVEEMLDMDVLLVKMCEEWQDEFVKLVKKVKGSDHNFCKVV